MNEWWAQRVYGKTILKKDDTIKLDIQQDEETQNDHKDIVKVVL